MRILKNPISLIEDVIFLKKNPIFAEVGTEELKAIAAIAEDRNFSEGALIVKEGEAGDSLFLVKIGSIRICKQIADKEVTLASLPTTSCFGEMVIFEDAARSASAYAEVACVLMMIRRDELLLVIQQYPRIAIQFFKVLGGRLRAANEKVKELSGELADHRAAHSKINNEIAAQ